MGTDQDKTAKPATGQAQQTAQKQQQQGDDRNGRKDADPKFRQAGDKPDREPPTAKADAPPQQK